MMRRAGTTRKLSTWSRVIGPAAVLAVVLPFLAWRLGTGPFVEGVRSVDAAALAAAVGIGVLTTLCCAWRWRTVARALEVELSLGTAVAAYYRSLFLNVTLPGGVVGDVHRGLSHGHDTRKVGRALRAVAWERFAGQVVQIVLTVLVLLALPSPVHAAMPLVAGALVVAVALVLVVARLRPDGASRFARARDTVVADVRGALLAPGARFGVALASALIVAGHALTFVIAARAAGTSAPLSRMLPIALLAMMAMTLPNVAGWGPREGVTAWAFGAAGLGAGAGVTTSVVYGVLAIVAALPGAAVLLVAWFRSGRHRARERSERPPLQEGAAHRLPARERPDRSPLGEGAAHA
ncbi:MAG TPA: lysylphosphatidylglycerol synthase transmembrane domain-containing protein [Solirubrobacterales bacterium]